MALFLSLHVDYYCDLGFCFSFEGPRLCVCYLYPVSDFNFSINSFHLCVLLFASSEGLSYTTVMLCLLFIPTLVQLFFTVLGNPMAASSVGVSAISFGKFLVLCRNFCNPPLPVSDVLAPS